MQKSYWKKDYLTLMPYVLVRNIFIVMKNQLIHYTMERNFLKL